MKQTTPKYRHKLNKEQLNVLQLLYKFRFGTSELIAQYLGKKNGIFVHKRLKILQEQGLINRRFDGKYKIQGKPAAYYLLPAGARLLQEHAKDNKAQEFSISSLYRLKSVSNSFIEHSLDIFSAFITIKGIYGDRLKFFTKSDLKVFDYFPEQLPDAYMRISIDGADKQYFLDFFQASTPLFVVARRIQQYVSYAEEGDWEATESSLPTVLLVCGTKSLERRLQMQISRLIEDIDSEELRLFATTSGELKACSHDTDKIWRNIVDSEDSSAIERI